MKKPIIIGFSGKKQSGKGTSCKFLTENVTTLWPEQQGCYRPYINTFSIAGPIKKVCIEVLGLAPEQVYGTESQKNSLTPYRWKDLPHYPTIRQQCWDRARASACFETTPTETSWLQAERYFDSNLPTGLMTARQVMQQIGSIFRAMYVDVWAEACIRSILSAEVDVALIDDVRFPNEVEHIHKAGGVVYRLTRCVDNKDEHESEKALDPDRFDWKGFDGVIRNEGLMVSQQNRELVERLYHDGLLGTALKLCECCDGIDPETLNYEVAA